jgi:RHS repeat-associated protein
MKHGIHRSLLLWSLVTAVSLGVSPAVHAATGDPSLTITAEQLLLNDHPGPANEATQTLTITGIRTTAATHGTATFANGVVTYIPDAGFQGTAVLFYTACDNGATNGQPDPRCSETTISINVIANRAPIANSQSLATPEDSPVGVTLTASDPDADAINFTIVSPPSHGTLTGTAPGLTYVPAPNFHGIDTFTFAADDGQDQSFPATITFNVSEVNDPPAPQADQTTVGAGNPVAVPASFLLSNDVAGPFDEAGQTLTVTAATAGADTHGTVSLNAGIVTYTPDQGFVGTAVIAYTVCDNGATSGLPDPRCADSALSIVLNGPPVAKDQSVQTVRTTPLPLVLSATDPEGDALTYAIASAPLHGTFSGTPPAVTYAANTGFSGNDSFTFTAKDAYSTSNAATVSILVKDLPPVVLGPDSFTVVTGGTALVDVLANDVAGTGTMNAATLTISSSPTKGVAVVEADQIRYTPNAATTGADTFGYTACDSAGACGTSLVNVTITTNHPPTATGDSYTMDAGTTLNVTPPGLLVNDSDPDAGDRIQARLGTGVGAGNLLLRSDGSFTYTPLAIFAGTDSFTYFVTDRAGAASPPVTVTIDVIPPGPIAVDDTYTTQTNNPLTVAPAGVLANDRDPHSTGKIVARLDRAPFHGTVDLTPNGGFVYTPDPAFVGADTFRYVAVDLSGQASAAAFVTINVTAAGGPVPTLSCTSPTDGGRVTAPTPVAATVTAPAGQTIATWTVSARNVDRGVPVVLASGTGQPPATLATFDPTLVINGAYQILTTAVSSGGGTTTCTSNVFVSGEMKLGDYQTTDLDMVTSIAGFPVQLLRTYDTKDKRQGDFGIGWRLDLSGPRVTPNGRLGQRGWFTTPFGQPFTRFRFDTTVPHFVTVTSPGGRVELFDFTPPPTGPLLSLTVPAFTARPGTGTTSTLEDIDSPTLSLAGDSLAIFLDGSIYDPRLFRLTTKDGVVMIIDRYDGLQSMTDRNGNTLTFSATGVTSSSTSRSLAFVRDGAGRITEIDGPNAKRTQYAYSSAGDLSQFIDANGTLSAFSYDGNHRLLSVDGPGGTRLRTLNYGPDGRLTSLTDGTGRTITLSSDVNAKSQIDTSPSGRRTTISTYDTNGHLASVEEVFDAHSRVTSYQYDSEGRKVRTTSPLGRVETLSYDAAGNLTSRTTPKSETWTYAFNGLNEVTTVTAPDGNAIESHTYDALGNLIAETMRDGRTRAYVNDGRGLPVTVISLFGTTTLAYDADQQLTEMTDPAGGVTRWTYDASGRLATIEDAAHAITRYTWNAFDRLVGVTAADGSTQTSQYDDTGRLVRSTDSAGRPTTYSYDAANRLVASVDRAAQTTTYAYDQDGKRSTIAYADGDVTNAVWDPVGRLTSVSDADTVVEMAYNDANDLISERARGNNGIALPDVTLAYVTDAGGLRTALTGPGGEIRYGYDTRSRITSVRDPAARTFSLGYDGGTDLLLSLLRPNGANDTLTYAEDQLIGRDTLLGGTLLNQIGYTLDSLGRRTSLFDLDGTHTFGHDLASRLTSASHPSASGLASEAFAYDAVDNRISWNGSPANTVTYDAGMQLLSDGTYDYVYDADGRMIQRRERASGGVTRYSWSSSGRLMSITAPGGSTSTYRYDALGRRVEANDNGVVRRFVYSRGNLLNEFDGANSLRATYVTGLELGSVLEIVRDGSTYFPLIDGVGSVTALTDSSGTVVGRTRYSAFGVPATTGVTDRGFTFTGHQFDEPTGLVFARERYYDPGLGRFLSQDLEPATNPYAYVFDAPYEFTDPTGRAAATEYKFTVWERIKLWLAGSSPAAELARRAANDRSLQRAAQERLRQLSGILGSTGEATPIDDTIYRTGGGGL